MKAWKKGRSFIVANIQTRRPGRTSIGLGSIVAITLASLVLAAGGAAGSSAQASGFVIYNDNIASGWVDWSDDGADVNLFNSSPVYSGTYSASFAALAGNVSFYLHTDNAVSTAPYTHLHLAARASQDGQKYAVAVVDTNDNYLSSFLPLANYGGDPAAGSWKLYNIPLKDLGAAGKGIKGVLLMETTGQPQPAVFLDDIRLTAGTSAPSTLTSTPSQTKVPPPSKPPTQVPASPTKSPTSAPTQTPPTPAPPSSSFWTPALNTAWQWQLTTPVDQSVNVPVYDIDGFDNTAGVVASLHAQGRKVICYVNVGTWENWRSDAGQFPSSVLGGGNGWPGEKWLDIRQISVIGPIMQARFDMCKAKGFDAIEPDNIDGYSNSTGFPLSYQDQINYNTLIAQQAHALGLSIGLKNDLGQVADLLPHFDWALNEQCFQYGECSALTPFIKAGKAVFEVEYGGQTSQFCSQANAMNFNAMLKNLNLDAYRVPCR
jgi:hypothetical protein